LKKWEIPGRRGKNLPLYPYRCTQCGHCFERIQKFGAKPEKVCPQCGGALERPLTAPGLQFKGAGWYVNDYAAKGSSTKDSSSAAESALAEKKDAPETKTAPACGGNCGAACPAASTPAATTSSSND
jgi:putative FmdB family regulatory protein